MRSASEESRDLLAEGQVNREDTRRYPIAAVDRAVAILAALDGKESCTVAEVGRRVGLSEPTVLRYLENLCWHGLVERNEQKRYRLSLRLFQLGQRALAHQDPRTVALPFLESLLERFGETVNLGVRSGDELILIEVLESSRAIKKGATVGESDSWHSSALGKALLAWLPDEEVRAILERKGSPRRTSKTLTTFEELSRNLERVRTLGYAVDDEEGEEGLRCVSVAIFSQHETPRYAISLSGPANRFSSEVIENMGAVLSSAAAAISERLGYLAPSAERGVPPVQLGEGQ